MVLNTRNSSIGSIGSIMASWKKYFSAVPSQTKLNQKLSQSSGTSGTSAGTGAKYSSYLPEVYSGAPNRVERYIQYEQMDLDSEISKGLDILADYSVQNYEAGTEPFQLTFNGEMTETEIKILKDMLHQWCKLNKWQQRLWRSFRNTIKYGDQIFIRDPETFKLIWIDPAKVEKIIVNEDKGKSAEQYVIKDIDLNLQALVGSNMLIHDQYSFPGGYPRSSNPAAGAGTINYGISSSPGGRTSRFDLQQNELAVDATHVVHLSLSEGMDSQWPFGTSILESIYKVYKQKDLLEDCILIYRVVRAPERRVFYIDTGSLSGPRAQQVIERMKNEIYQRRIPNRTGGGQCLDLNTQIPLLDGRSLSLSDLITEFNAGKTNWAYSTDTKTGHIVPGVISWAGITRKNTQVIKLTLDNGSTLIVTPDHKIPILGKGDVQAQYIEINKDSLISFNTRFESINGNNNRTDPQYHQIFNHSIKNWMFTHRMVANYFKSIGIHNELIYDQRFVNERKSVIHHVDYNKHNNSPENLAFMSGVDHFKLHANTYSNWWNSLTETQRTEYKQKNADAVRAAYASNPELGIKLSNSIKLAHKNDPTIRDRMSVSSVKNWKRLKESLMYLDFITKKSEYRSAYLKLHPEEKIQNQSNVFDEYMLSKCVDTVVRVGSNSKAVCNALSTDVLFMDHYKTLNAPIDGRLAKFNFDKFSKDTLVKLVKAFGYTSWSNFTASFGHNIQKSTLKISFDQRHISILVDMVKKDPALSKSLLPNLLNTNREFINLLAEKNKNKRGNANVNNITLSTVNTMLSTFGYNGWNDFKSKAMQYNHKIVSIEWLEDTRDTGTITIDGNEIYHGHHNFATDSGVFVCNSILDAAYSPIAINEDFFLAQNSEGKGTRIETLPGGENLGQIDDLKYFNNKLIRGLGIPSSYLPTGPEDGQTQWQDGKVGTAYIQELRFAKVCQRLQNLTTPELDREFKLYLKYRGIEIESDTFELKMWEPQSFGQYRQMALDNEQIAVFSSLIQTEAAKYISKRYALKRYLRWSDEDILENEKLWKEENAKKVKDKTGETVSSESQPGLSTIGVRAPTDAELAGTEPEPTGETPAPEAGAPAGPTTSAVAPEAGAGALGPPPGA